MDQSKRTMMYWGYTGSVEYSEENKVFHGKILGIRSLVSYEGVDLEALEQDFQGAIDDYLEVYRTEQISPKGGFSDIEKCEF